MLKPDKLLTTTQVAKILNVSTRTVTRRINNKTIKAININKFGLHPTWRVSSEEIQSLLDKY